MGHALFISQNMLSFQHSFWDTRIFAILEIFHYFFPFSFIFLVLVSVYESAVIWLLCTGCVNPVAVELTGLWRCQIAVVLYFYQRIYAVFASGSSNRRVLSAICVHFGSIHHVLCWIHNNIKYWVRGSGDWYCEECIRKLTPTEKGRQTASTNATNIFVFICMVLLLILPQFFSLKGCLGGKPEKEDYVHARLNCWEDACDQLVVNESKKTEQDPLVRIVR